MVAAEGRTRATVSAHEVRKSFGTGRGSRRRVVDVLRGVDLRVMPGEMVGIVGPSGSGKSTLLYCLSGLEEADAGSIEVMGRQVVGAGRGELFKTRRDCVGFIFQSYNLIPSLTAGENVSLPARLAGRPLTAAQTGAVLASVGLEGRAKSRPADMSGGEQQRVAIARALVKMPKILLLDEPLSNLDARLRLQTREEIRRIQKATGITTVFVTHDQEEAMSISDLIVVMKDGVVQQIGKPQAVYDSPVNLFVAKFLGTPPINVFDGEVKDGQLYIGEEAVLAVPGVANQSVTAAIRPEGFTLSETGALSCDLSRVEVMGRDISVVSTHPKSQNVTIRSIISAENAVNTASQKVRFDLKPNKVFLFQKESGARIDFG